MPSSSSSNRQSPSTASPSLTFVACCLLLSSTTYIPGTAAFITPSQTQRIVIAQQPPPTITTSTALRISRQICTFDSSDFESQSPDWPYDATDLARLDGADDGVFYGQPRFVTHIDDYAIESLTAFYEEEFTALLDAKKKKKNKGEKSSDSNNHPKKLDVLDLCSSWISHLPKNIEYNRVAGIGMNERELAKNEQLTEFHCHDLNTDPNLKPYFRDDSFDVVCNVVSVDYLTKPKEVFEEMHRVLRPGGVALVSFSNRCFPSKAVSMWLRADDIGRLAIVGSYFYYGGERRDAEDGEVEMKGWSGGIEALDIKLPPLKIPERPSVGDIFKDYTKAFAWASTAGAVAKSNSGDPMFVVKAIK